MCFARGEWDDVFSRFLRLAGGDNRDCDLGWPGAGRGGSVSEYQTDSAR